MCVSLWHWLLDVEQQQPEEKKSRLAFAFFFFSFVCIGGEARVCRHRRVLVADILATEYSTPPNNLLSITFFSLLYLSPSGAKHARVHYLKGAPSKHMVGLQLQATLHNPRAISHCHDIKVCLCVFATYSTNRLNARALVHKRMNALRACLYVCYVCKR